MIHYFMDRSSQYSYSFILSNNSLHGSSNSFLLSDNLLCTEKECECFFFITFLKSLVHTLTGSSLLLWSVWFWLLFSNPHGKVASSFWIQSVFVVSLYNVAQRLAFDTKKFTYWFILWPFYFERCSLSSHVIHNFSNQNFYL